VVRTSALGYNCALPTLLPDGDWLDSSRGLQVGSDALTAIQVADVPKTFVVSVSEPNGGSNFGYELTATALPADENEGLNGSCVSPGVIAALPSQLNNLAPSQLYGDGHQFEDTDYFEVTVSAPEIAGKVLEVKTTS
jgi:hypothetical protein